MGLQLDLILASGVLALLYGSGLRISEALGLTGADFKRITDTVTVTATELTVRKVNPRGAVREWTLNPVWVRLDRAVHEEFGIERLFLVSHGRRLSVANFLSPDEKASFATALSAALGEAKRGPTRTVL